MAGPGLLPILWHVSYLLKVSKDQSHSAIGNIKVIHGHVLDLTAVSFVLETPRRLVVSKVPLYKVLYVLY